MGEKGAFPDSMNDALTPVERARIEFILNALRPGEMLNLAEAREVFHENLSRRLDVMPELLSGRSARMGSWQVVDVFHDGPSLVEVRMRDEKERLWALRVRLHPEPPHRIDMLSLARPLPSGAIVRGATDADAPAIERIESGSGIERRDGSRVTTVLGARLLELTRLMEDGRLWIVEIEGQPAACDAIAVRRVRHEGREVRLLYRHHTRVLPSFRRLGLNEALAARAGELGQTELRSAVNVAYVDPNNSAIKTWTRIPAWRSRPFRAFLSCAALAGPVAGRSATAHDSAMIAGTLNALHDHEALYVPYDSSRLTERLSRRPLAYGWSQLLVGSGAVLGVWNAAERATLETPSGRLERRRAFVLDYGFLPGGGLDEFERLIRSSCRRLDAEGITHLSIFCSRGSPAEALIRSLAEQVVDVEFLCGLPEPESAGLSGVYVDHLYF